EDIPAVPLPRLGERFLQLLGGIPGQGAQHGGGEARAGVAIAGGIGRAGREARGGTVGEDARDGVAAAVVVAEGLAEEGPDGGDRVAQPVTEADAVLVEGGEDAGPAQRGGEGQALVAREADADLLEGGHSVASGGLGDARRGPPEIR